jgi:Uma2 family endonuclease
MSSPVNTPVYYPTDDGLPMSDNTEQFGWIQVIEGNLETLFRDRADVFVGGNLLWYPVEGFDKVRRAPDIFVVFGRPKGRRGSYLQWEEDGIPFTVVIEVRSPNDSDKLMREKLEFYDEHGVSEYYMFDPKTPPEDAIGRLLIPAEPERQTLEVYVRRGDQLGPQRLAGGCFTSPLLGVRFDLSGDELVIYLPNQRRFLTYPELEAERVAAEAAREVAQQQREAAVKQRDDAIQKRDEAIRKRDTAVQERKRLIELGRKARLGQASPEELLELERLESESA